jgi:hypothetical protein
MNKIFVFACLAILFGCAQAYTLPKLYTINSYEFSVPYSCNGNYSTSALFLSSYGLQYNNPDLLYNGACDAAPYVMGATAGNDLSDVTDLGVIPIEKVSAYYTQNPHWNYTASINVQQGHTYAVMNNKADFRSLFVFSVDSLVPNGPMSITYSVLLYELHSITQQSPGFNWEQLPGQN